MSFLVGSTRHGHLQLGWHLHVLGYAPSKGSLNSWVEWEQRGEKGRGERRVE